MKVVINACFGGFGLSDAGIKKYAEIAGIKLYPECREHGFVTYWKVPESERPAALGGSWTSHTMEEREAYNKAYEEAVLCAYDIPRDDKILVRVVEEIGAAANGECANLRVVEIPDGVNWEIEEYDGNEHVAETHRTWR